MGTHNVTVNRLLERKSVFADLMNGTLYQGEQILQPEQLELLSPHAGILFEGDSDSKKSKALERTGDIRMKASLPTYSLILANETQQSVHYGMVVRNMLYQVLEYVKQCQDLEKMHMDAGDVLRGSEFLSKMKKDDKLTPVITVVLYFGENWDGPLTLHEMLAWEGMNDEKLEPELRAAFEAEWALLMNYIPDYKLNLIQASDIQDTAVFHTCLQQIFGMIQCRKDKNKMAQYMEEHREVIKKMDDVERSAALILLGEQKRLYEILERYQNSEEEWNMCQAFDEMFEDCRQEGLQKGLEEGRQKGRQEGRQEGFKALVKTCREFDLSTAEIVQRLVTSFLISEEEAKKSVELYS